MPRSPLPPPLPPEDRTVGQLVAESIRLYRDNFWRAILLGFAPAALDLLVNLLPKEIQLQVPAAVIAGSILTTAAFIWATVIVTGARPSQRTVGSAFVVGWLIWPPAVLLPFLFALSGNIWVALIGLVLPSLAWLAYTGLSVPASVVEDLDYRRALGRGMDLGRVDFVHVLGGLATLVICFFLTRYMLLILLHGGAKEEVLTATFLADLALSPVLFLGSALLYVDQRARLDRVAAPDPKGGTNADVHPAEQPDGAGRADAEVEPRPAARGES